MYLHLGQDVVVLKSSIIGIFDMDNTTQSYITRAFLNAAEKAGSVISVTEELPRSFVVCQDGEETKVYLSQLSSATLLKRNSGGFEQMLQ